MSVEEVAAEVRSVFKEPMDNRNDFPFGYLQPTGSGSRTLSIPSVSSSSWTAKQVARIGNNTGTIYILANDDLVLNDDDEVQTYYVHVHWNYYQLSGILSKHREIGIGFGRGDRN